MEGVQYYKVNKLGLKGYVEYLDQINPQRTHGYIDLFIQNIKNNLLEALDNQEEFVIELDHDKKKASLFGDEIQIQNRDLLISGEATQEKLYKNIVDTLEVIKKDLSQGTNIIKEIHPKQ